MIDGSFSSDASDNFTRDFSPITTSHGQNRSRLASLLLNRALPSESLYTYLIVHMYKPSSATLVQPLLALPQLPSHNSFNPLLGVHHYYFAHESTHTPTTLPLKVEHRALAFQKSGRALPMPNLYFSSSERRESGGAVAPQLPPLLMSGNS